MACGKLLAKSTKTVTTQFMFLASVRVARGGLFANKT